MEVCDESDNTWTATRETVILSHEMLIPILEEYVKQLTNDESIELDIDDVEFDLEINAFKKGIARVTWSNSYMVESKNNE